MTDEGKSPDGWMTDEILAIVREIDPSAEISSMSYHDYFEITCDATKREAIQERIRIWLRDQVNT